MQTLDVRFPDQVGSKMELTADLADGRKLMVLSGIAMTNWEVDNEDYEVGETHVRLGVYASRVDEASAIVGLASIANDETPFVFVVDQVRVEPHKDTDELELIFKPVLMGEPSAMHRVAYQVVVTMAQIRPHISGRIIWVKDFFEPASDDVSSLKGQLTVIANRIDRITPPDGLAYDDPTPVAFGHFTKLEIIRSICTAHYRIDDPPMGVPLRVTVNPGFGFVVAPPATIAVGRIAGPDLFTLKGSKATVDGLDFAVGALKVK